MAQSTQNILMIRPASFGFNPETACSNAFQSELTDSGSVKKNVWAEFEAFVTKLRSRGVNVFIFDDTREPAKPDAVFPNNWVSFHADGTVIIYPMAAANRRAERRREIILALGHDFEINDIVDLSRYEKENRFLEGTGSIVFDHVSQTAFACLSPRTDPGLLAAVCERLGYMPLTFHAHDRRGKEIYHTNVMMCLADKFAVVCLESITDKIEREAVSNSMTAAGHQIIDISFDQMEHFAGNMLALLSQDGEELLALSQQACENLTAEQIETIKGFCTIVPLSIPTIETVGGGSARCMIAEIFLPSRSATT